METSLNNPAERKKLIGAIALGVLAIILLWWAFIGFGSSSTTNTGTRVTQRTPATNDAPTPRPIQSPNQGPAPEVDLRPINFDFSVPAVSEARRNIFIYYEKPPPPTPPPPSPSPPPPPPPVLLAGVSPSTVYAQTGEFTLEVTGDKFTPQLRIVLNNVELPTRYRSAQQMSAVVPASAIQSPGSRQVFVRTPDGKLFSNAASLNVTAPPTPNFTFVGIIGTKRYTLDTAIMQDKSSREILNVQRGDLLGNRFRVTSISEKEVVAVDTSLKIRHTIPFTSGQTVPGGATARPTPRVESEDDEP